MTPLPVSVADLDAAARRLAGVAHRTPVMRSQTIDALTGAQVVFKCENLQRMGAFKFRGAFNALAAMSEAERRRGVLAFSSGNHAQAVALAAREFGVPAVIVMPDDAPRVKLTATRDYGAEVVLYNRQTTRREDVAAALAASRNLPLIPPFDHPDVVAGQGTAALELFDDVGHLDMVLVPCGGGGLLSGTALAASVRAPGCRVIGVEPETADDATRSFRTRTLQTCEHTDTIADGARTPSLGTVTFPMVLALVADMVTVDDDALLRAMRVLAERMKLVVEPTGVLGAAALLEGRVPVVGRRVGVVLSGGNVELGSFQPASV